MSTPLTAEIDRLRLVERRLLLALQLARTAIDAALGDRKLEPIVEWAYCRRCETNVPTIDNGETCAHCKLVL